MSARHIDTLMGTQHSVILHLGYHGRTIDSDDLHIKSTIIKQYVVTFLNICRKILIGKIDNVVRGVDVRTSEEFNNITRLILKRGCTSRSTDLRTFGIYKYTKMTAHLAHVPYYILNSFFRSMRCIHSDNINTGIVQLPDKIYITATITD